ncbi:MAG: transpeptidase family protein, partial [Bacteroidetes bacterium]|nr:transpeptidase family protein [Bacteroidota bacterium]
MALRNDILWRIGIVYVTVLLLAITVIGRIIYLQIVEGEELRKKANAMSQKDITILPNRGDICASDGRLLASSVPYYDIHLDLATDVVPDSVFDSGVDGLAFGLAGILENKSYTGWKKELLKARSQGRRYFPVKRKVSYSRLQKIKELPICSLGRFRGGFIVEQTNNRTKPFVKLASRTVGYLGENNHGEIVGKVGLEHAYESELRGVKGVRLMQKISGGGWMPVNDASEVEAQDGKDVITTIDVNIQDVAESALLTQLKKHDAHHGCAILMEVETGEIKAIANLERCNDGDYRETYNFAIGESAETGSTFKLMSLIVGLEDDVFDLEDSTDTKNGKIKYFNETLYDSRPGGYGVISNKDVFAYSSNVGVSRLIYEHYKDNPQRFIDRLYRMNIMEPLNIEIAGEEKPYINTPQSELWWGASLAWIAIGYEVKLTPLQVLAFYNAVANNGRMVKPRFVKALRYRGEIVNQMPAVVINPMICSKKTIVKAKELLEAVVEYGTGKNLKNDNYKVAGKTGTTQLNYNKIGEKMTYRASFVGYFPSDNPKYSCIVVITAPSNQVYYGSQVAGPVFKEIADKVYATSLDLQKDIDSVGENVVAGLPYSHNGYGEFLHKVYRDLNISVRDEAGRKVWAITTRLDTAILMQGRNIYPGIVPDVKGMGARDAVYLLENAGLKVVLIGRGRVVNQSVSPGGAVTKGEKV